MNILAIDTSSSNLLVSLKTNTQTYNCPKIQSTKHLETLLPQIENLLEQAELKPINIDILGVVVGPGSFTGIRIGVATAKAFMCAFKKIKCVAVNSLDLLAYNTLSKSNTIDDVICVIPSTLKKFYVGVFRGKDRELEDCLMETEELKNFINKKGCKVVVPADTTLDFCPECEQLNVGNDDLLDYIERAKIDDSFVTINQLKPYYLGLSQAELDLIKKESKDGTDI